ncbi:MAG: sulfatase-like hydrolase/transferase [Gammaproteobacteria bacterium]|nr:sulfatase-like hydrolase/transferase [Gammaproteobacteria bacterium]
MTLLPSAFAATADEIPGRPPNVLLIVVDDMGFSDLGAFGSEISTPNLDRLAMEGSRLGAFYASPTCSPTRAMLLSGTSSHEAGLGNMRAVRTPNQIDRPGYEGHLNFRVASLAALMRDAGYFTAMSGKWHLGNEPEHDPAARGFERAFALIPGGHNHFGWGLIAPKGISDPLYREDGQTLDDLPADFYSSDTFTDKLLEYLEDREHDDARPFFALLSYTAPHWPLQAPKEDIARHKGRYDDGYVPVLLARHAAMEELGIQLGDPDPQIVDLLNHAWQALSPDERRVESRRMEIYAAMIDRMDRNVGRVIELLEEQEQLDETLVIFLSDNGAEGERVERSPIWKEFVAANFDHSFEAMGSEDSFVTTGPYWATVSSSPFRLFKRYPTEGGIRVAAFVRYPGVVRAGGVRLAPMTVMDIAPTLLELAGAEPPAGVFQGREVLPMRGQSLLAYLSGDAQQVHDPQEVFGWELFGRRAVRMGTWKAINIDTRTREGHWELFDLQRDPGERNDLAPVKPDRLKQMLGLWDKYAEEVGVILPDRQIFEEQILLPE